MTSPASSATPALSELTAPQGTTIEELLAKVVVLRQAMAQNYESKIEGAADRVYAWIGNTPQRIVSFEAMGWKVCKDPKVQCSAPWRKADGTIVRGDTIVMEISLDRYQLIKFEEQLRAVELVQGPTTNFKQLAAAQGIKVFEPKEKE